LRRWGGGIGANRPFLVFLSLSCLFNFGMFIFYLIYNLYLLDLGFKEDLLGAISSASTTGSMAGTLAAVGLHRRVGLQRSLIIFLVGTALVSTLRALITVKWILIGAAFVSGTLFSIWAVSIAVIIAQITTDRQRVFAFSVYIATVIGVGIAGDAIGGRLPLMVEHAFALSGAIEAKRWTLFIGAWVAGLAAVPASSLRFAPVAQRAGRHYPRGPFIWRFLAALALINLATGAFNPFSNAYFAQYLKVPVDQIGLIFSGGQMAQVIAIVLSPIIIRRVGLVWGIVSMEVAAGISLLFLSTGPAPIGAALGYGGYLAFQWMDEPAMDTLLMGRVDPSERSGASALMYMVMFGSTAVAAYVSGQALTRIGYPRLMIAAASLLLAGALSFGLLLRKLDLK
jgi:MFS family permease